jgi:hypothetical protein
MPHWRTVWRRRRRRLDNRGQRLRHLLGAAVLAATATVILLGLWP